MAELADAQDLGSCTLRVWVQVPLTAVNFKEYLEWDLNLSGCPANCSTRRKYEPLWFRFCVVLHML